MKRSKQDVVEYSGYRLTSGNPSVPEISEPISREDFHAKFISTRTPVVLRGYMNWKQTPTVKSSPNVMDALRDIGDVGTLKVEKKVPGASRSFGLGNEVAMTLPEFLDNLLVKKDTSLYMSSQPLQFHADGRPKLLSEPCQSLVDSKYLVLHPDLFGNLIPSNLNIWMGLTSTPTSSGLHHDFHDNLYVLVEGRKKFNLFDPSLAPYMQLSGSLKKVHTNGRFVYESHPNVNADGSDATSLIASQLEFAIENASDEDEIDKLMDQALDCEFGDDFDCDFDSDLEVGDSESEQEPLDNFCGITSFEELEGHAGPAVVELGPSDGLYLPCGWFHEVSSYSTSPNKTTPHVAFNYWSHPPDTNSFDSPYSTDFWKKDFEARML